MQIYIFGILDVNTCNQQLYQRNLNDAHHIKALQANATYHLGVRRLFNETSWQMSFVMELLVLSESNDKDNQNHYQQND